MVNCINLRERFGDRYKVRYEESYRAQYGPGGRTEDPWLMILLCQHGHICPWSENTLVAVTDKREPIADRLAVIGRIKSSQWRAELGSRGLDVLIFAKTPAIGK